MRTVIMKSALLVLLLMTTLVSSCVVTPKLETRYDERCQAAHRQMTLEVTEIASISSCHDEACLAAIAVAGVVAAGSTVISGSIVVISNVVYWAERKARCKE